MAACEACGRPLLVAPQTRGARWTMYHGDALELLAGLPDESIDAIITDPPYGSGGDSALERTRPSKAKYVNSKSSYQKTLLDMSGDALHPLEWAANLDRWMAAAARLLQPGGHLLAFIDWRNVHLISAAVMRAGLRARGVVVWDKGRGSRPMRNGFRLQTEFVVHATRGAVPRRGQDIYLDGVVAASTIAAGKQHITQKPLPLMRYLMRIVPPGSRVLDPFAGSGTTGVAAIEAGHEFIGYELVGQYFDTAVARLRAAEAAAAGVG